MRHSFTVGTLALVACSASLFGACSSDDAVDATVVESPVDASAVEDAAQTDTADAATPVTDADAASSDADAGDAGTDAACTVDWCETALPIPDGGKLTLMGAWAPRAGDAWAVSEEGQVLRWQAGAWSVVWNADVALYGIWGDAEGDIWLVGAAGTIFRGPGGKDWAPLSTGVTTDLVGICEASRDLEHARNVAVVGEDGIVLRWDGAIDEFGAPIWQTSDVDALSRLYAISCAGSDIWVSGTSTDWVSTGARLYRSGAAGWTAVSATAPEDDVVYERLSSVWASGTNDVWTRGFIYIFHAEAMAGGEDYAWTKERSTLDVDGKHPTAIWGSGPNDVWLAASRGRVHHWNGTKLDISSTAKGWDVLGNNLHGIAGSSAEDVWVVGDDIALHRNVSSAGQDH